MFVGMDDRKIRTFILYLVSGQVVGKQYRQRDAGYHLHKAATVHIYLLYTPFYYSEITCFAQVIFFPDFPSKP
jgi:hypothetical protein